MPALRSSSPLIALAVLLCVPPASAQERRSREKPAAPAAEGHPAATAPAPAGDIRVRAESYEQTEKGHLQARGLVDLRVGDIRIQADKADVYEETRPDGTIKRRLVAEGNVVFLRGEERLSGDRVEMDDTGHGFFENAIGYVEPGVFVQGRRVERVDDHTYRVQGGKFTSCAQPAPRWSFTSSDAKIEVDDKIIAKNAVFKVKGVPAFYLPYVYYPISRDGRSTGFLFPHFGHSSTKGYTVGSGFFWVMGRSADQTFYADYYSKIGYGLGHELRYLEKSPSRGTFRTYLFALNDQLSLGGKRFDYDIDWNALQMLPGKVRATVNVRQYSDLLFQQRFQDDFNRATNRTQRWSGSIEKDFGLAVLSAYADTTSTYFGTVYTRVNGRLPGARLRRFPRQVGWGGIVFGLDAAADRIQYGDQIRVDNWARFDVAPTISRPLHLSFLEFTPSVGYRYTRYGSSYGIDDSGENAIIGPAINRSFAETSVEMRGPTFSKVFDTPGFGYSPRLKHTIGPEVTWTYRTRVEDFNSIPKFDGSDYFLGTNQISYALVQRLYAKRRGTGGKLLPYEFFLWRLQQTYYVQIAEGQSNFDPNYSSSAYGPGFKPEHLSPLSSRMRIRPTPGYSLDFNVEYDVNFKQIRRTSLFGNVALPRATLTAGWSRSLRLSEDPTQRTVGAHTLRGTLATEVLSKRLFVEGSTDYDLVNHILWQMRAQVRYAVQCCGFTVENIRYNWNGRDEVQWRFNLQLAGIGSMGNFLGADASGRGTAYR
jgi:lipopolysaccharide assembly outer membrane protein LptD (OstA)